MDRNFFDNKRRSLTPETCTFLSKKKGNSNKFEWCFPRCSWILHCQSYMFVSFKNKIPIDFFHGLARLLLFLHLFIIAILWCPTPSVSNSSRMDILPTLWPQNHQWTNQKYLQNTINGTRLSTSNFVVASASTFLKHGVNRTNFFRVLLYFLPLIASVWSHQIITPALRKWTNVPKNGRMSQKEMNRIFQPWDTLVLGEKVFVDLAVRTTRYCECFLESLDDSGSFTMVSMDM